MSPGATAVQTHYSPTTDMHRSSLKGKKEENHLLNLLPILQIFPFFIATNSAISSYSTFTMCKEEFPSLPWWLTEIHHLLHRKVQHVFTAMHSRESLLCQLRSSATVFDPNSTTTFFFPRYHLGKK